VKTLPLLVSPSVGCAAGQRRRRRVSERREEEGDERAGAPGQAVCWAGSVCWAERARRE
jgi:hypothetical protein